MLSSLAVMVRGDGCTVKLCVTLGAARKAAAPAWLAVMTQVPAVSAVTFAVPVPLPLASVPPVAPERLQTGPPVAAKVTGWPEPPPVAEMVKGAPP